MNEPYNPGRPFRLTSRYGPRIHPVTDKETFHAGQDFAAPAGTPIQAATPGRVVYSGFNDKFGNTVIVQTTDGYSLYAHMKDGAPRAQLNQEIWPGDVIGQVGSTGEYARGNHLHYSIIKRGEAVNNTNEGGRIGIGVDRDRTVDPATFDNSVPYMREPLGAAGQMYSGVAFTIRRVWRDVGRTTRPAAGLCHNRSPKFICFAASGRYAKCAGWSHRLVRPFRTFGSRRSNAAWTSATTGDIG
ncbi:M23 family metallopeptidase [Bradyrhizobium sp. Tv2a-2]|uniref:M23 family metallopeptidase n=1 Tax=Bradyrhizobium sp. Tv2a-2 TaxID=113395 RepID=UPI0004661E25|nr:M23 family metallopeptidase [Bradyrhizobium sp. Tv2a-2]